MEPWGIVALVLVILWLLLIFTWIIIEFIHGDKVKEVHLQDVAPLGFEDLLVNRL